MPWRRTGRSTSTMPWSKSISITRSAITHSRPIETCWYAEIVHSWPSTVFAPIETTPSWARIFVAWPTHDQRPSSIRPVLPISRITLGPMKAKPSSFRRRPYGVRSLRRASRTRSRAYFGVSMRLRRMNRRRVSGPPRRGGGGPRRPSSTSDGGGPAISWTAASTATRSYFEWLRRRAIAPPPLVPFAPRAAAPQHRRRARRTAVGGREARARARDLARRERRPGGVGARPRGLPEDRPGGRGGLHGPARRRQVDADRDAREERALARAEGRGALYRPFVAVHEGCAAGRPDPADRPLPRPGRVHPLDGVARVARRALGGHVAGRAADGRRRQRRRAARDGRCRPGGGRHHRSRGHGGAGADA